MKRIISLSIGEARLEVPGKWVYHSNYNYIISSAEASYNVGVHQLDLSEYLPNDDYVYEIQGYMAFVSNGNDVIVSLGNTQRINRYFTEHTSQYWDTHKFNIEILKDKKLVLQVDTDRITNAYIALTSYRRLYKDNVNE